MMIFFYKIFGASPVKNIEFTDEYESILAQREEFEADEIAATDELSYEEFFNEGEQEKLVLANEEDTTVYEEPEMTIEELQTETDVEEVQEQPVVSNNKKTISFDNRKIRVLIMTGGYKDIYHSKITISCENNFNLRYYGDTKIMKANDKIVIDNAFIRKIKKEIKDTGYPIRFQADGDTKIKLHDVRRSGFSKENPLELSGALDFYDTPSGVVLVNELPVETYLCGVVQSEMPSNYPTEALKVQAICARTYAYYQKQTYAYPDYRANVNDSTHFQVYMNVPETKPATEAVYATQNEVLTYNGELIESYYFSTSSGLMGGYDAWIDIGAPTLTDTYLKISGRDAYTKLTAESEREYKKYIDNGNMDDIEYNEPWYRWKYDYDLKNDRSVSLIKRIYNLSVSYPNKVFINAKKENVNEFKKEKSIKNIKVLERRKSGMITGLQLETDNYEVTVSSQYYVRKLFAEQGDLIVKKDGSTYKLGSALPSAFFYFDIVKDSDKITKIVFHGAGFGHGSGMSQNGSKCMAENGLEAEEILAYYYNEDISEVVVNRE